MHWTLQILVALCMACLFGNAVRVVSTGKVYFPGLLICAAWGLQQSYWFITGENDATLFLACDAAIIATLFRSLPSPREWLILGLFPVEWAAQAYGSGALSWWINWAAVALQMVLGLPWLASQSINHTVSHGPLRVEGVA